MPNQLVPLISLNDHPIRDASIWPVVSPNYSAASAYSVDAHVIYNNQLYRCISPIDVQGEEWTPAHWAATTVDEELRRGLRQGIDALHVIAREYDSLATYLVGSYAMRDGTFYRCVTEIQNGEVWTPAHWLEVTVATEIGAQREDFEAFGNSVVPEYDAESSYSKNSYVRKDGIMYRALADIAGFDPWDSAKWEVCTVGSELGNSRNVDKFMQNNIAPDYNSGRTYVSGELVMYNNKLYKCIRTVSVPEEWNSNNWSLTSVASEVSMTDITSVLGFYIDDDGFLAQNITSDEFDPSMVNLDEVLGFYISVDGYISQRTTV